MNNILVNDDKEFYLATILETHKNSYIVSRFIDNKKRKIKPEQVFISLDNDFNTQELINNMDKLISSIDTDLLIELLDPNKTYHYLELAKLNYGDMVNIYQQVAMLICLTNKKTQFVHINQGNFRQTTESEVEQIKAQLLKQEYETAEFEKYYQVFNGNNPDLSLIPMSAYTLLNKTSKQSTIYKALNKISLEKAIKPIEICKNIGLITEIDKYFEECFVRDCNFIHNEIKINPEHFKDITTNNNKLNVFSIDDSYTTEIDDALSIQYMSDHYIIGIHISAPALCDELDEIIAHNISTVYSPKLKITMLPEEVIKQFSLNEGRTLPVVSIYFKVDFNYNILDYYIRLENVTIRKNLRIEELESLFNESNLDSTINYPYEQELKTLYQFATRLEQKRDKITTNNLNVDYTFIFDNEKISLKPRVRGNPIDKLVSELMILANGSFGRILTNSFIPAIYRVKQPGYPVKTMLQPNSHTGLNVDYYTWATSPLRRSVDFINQKQLIHLIKTKKPYYSNTNPILLEVVENFDTKYAKYLDFQNKMERYWSFMYILQEQITHIDAIFFYKSQVQLDGLPITIDLQNQSKPRNQGDKIKLAISNINPIALTFDVKIVDNLI